MVSWTKYPLLNMDMRAVQAYQRWISLFSGWNEIWNYMITWTYNIGTRNAHGLVFHKLPLKEESVALNAHMWLQKFSREEKQRGCQRKERTLSATHSNYRRLIQKQAMCVCFRTWKWNKRLFRTANCMCEEKVKQVVIMSYLGKKGQVTSV